MLTKFWKTNQMLEETAKVVQVDWDKVKRLIEEGADVKAADSAVFRHAAFCRKVDVAALALQKGADIHANNNQAINKAVYNADLEIFDLLVKHDPDIVSGIRLGILSEARYRSEHEDNNPEYKERLKKVVALVDTLAAQRAEQEVETSFAEIRRIVAEDQRRAAEIKARMAKEQGNKP